MLNHPCMGGFCGLEHILAGVSSKAFPALLQQRRRKTAPSRYPGNRQRTLSPRQLFEASRQPSPGPLRSPRQPLPIPVNHQPFLRHPGNGHQTHRPTGHTVLILHAGLLAPNLRPKLRSRVPSSSCPSPRPQGGTAPTLAGGGMDRALRVPSLVGAVGPSYPEAVRSPEPVSSLSLLRGTVQPLQGASQNANHVSPLLKTLPGSP
ncbi:uncharacterized protein [Physeter macrocephalus]|uniref:Uncharacterized protein n=1 Tax=Physeter macrocephalus TaxID=9755 RepID=A0A9W2WBB1_PHYMC|nr:uncharacterized protein LOC129391577 [Physeter catodon]